MRRLCFSIGNEWTLRERRVICFGPELESTSIPNTPEKSPAEQTRDPSIQLQMVADRIAESSSPAVIDRALRLYLTDVGKLGPNETVSTFLDNQRQNALLAGFRTELLRVEDHIKNFACYWEGRYQRAYCNWGRNLRYQQIRGSLGNRKLAHWNYLMHRKKQLEVAIRSFDPKYKSPATIENNAKLLAGYTINKLLPDGSGTVRRIQLLKNTGWHDAYNKGMFTLEELRTGSIGKSNGTWKFLDDAPSRNPQLKWKDDRYAAEQRLAQEREGQPLRQPGFKPIDLALNGAPDGTFSDVNMAAHLENKISGIALAGQPQPRYEPPEQRRKRQASVGPSAPDLPRVYGAQPRTQREYEGMQRDLATFHAQQNDAEVRVKQRREAMNADFENSKWSNMDTQILNTTDLTNYDIAVENNSGSTERFRLLYTNNSGQPVWNMEEVKRMCDTHGMQVNIDPNKATSLYKTTEIFVRAPKDLKWNLVAKNSDYVYPIHETFAELHKKAASNANFKVLGFESGYGTTKMRLQVNGSKRKYEVSGITKDNIQKNLETIGKLESKLTESIAQLDNREGARNYHFLWQTVGPVVISGNSARFTLQRTGIFEGKQVDQRYPIVVNLNTIPNTFLAELDKSIRKHTA